MRLSDRPPDRVHPFGHGKNVYFRAFVVSVMLFAFGGAVALWEAYHKLRNPAVPRVSPWTYGVLAGGLVFESASFLVAFRSLHRTARGRSFREYWQETRDPTLVTVLLEDSAALASLLIAAIGIGLADTTGNRFSDAGASALIGVVLLGVAVTLAFENYSLLIGEAAPARIEAVIRRIAAADPDVTDVVALQTMHLGPETLLIVLAVSFRRELGGPSVVTAIARLHERIGEALRDTVAVRFIAIEPVHADAVVRPRSELSAPASPRRRAHASGGSAAG